MASWWWGACCLNTSSEFSLPAHIRNQVQRLCLYPSTEETEARGSMGLVSSWGAGSARGLVSKTKVDHDWERHMPWALTFPCVRCAHTNRRAQGFLCFSLVIASPELSVINYSDVPLEAGTHEVAIQIGLELCVVHNPPASASQVLTS